MNELKAKEGYYLTQVNIKNESDRLFVKAVKGANANTDYWREADENEKALWEQSHPIEDLPMGGE